MTAQIPYRLTRTDWLIIALVAALAVGLRLLPGLRTIDDAYITYRYARNVAQGVGFVYNAGENVLGTTTPVYTLLLAALGGLVRAGATPQGYPLVSAVVNALADGANAALLYTIARRLYPESRLPGAALGALWAISPASVAFAVGGMETSVYIAITLGTFALWLAGRTVSAAALAGVATLTRPDALIWAGPLALAMIAYRWARTQGQPFVRRLPWAELGAYLAVLTPWLLFGTLTFGSPLPHSIAAKSVAYQLPPTSALVGLLQRYATPFGEQDLPGRAPLFSAVAYLVLSLFGTLFLAYRDRRTLPLTLFPWLLFLTYALANPLLFRWYDTPAMPFYFLSIAAGVWGLAERISGLRPARWVLGVAALLWVGIGLNAWTLHPDHGPDRPAPNMAYHVLELLYQDAASSVAPDAVPGTVIAAGDIGAVGWYGGADVLDTLGLISPQATEFYPIPPEMLGSAPYAVAPGLIEAEQPDFIIVLETYVRNSLLKDAWFNEHYRLRRKIETDMYGSDGMLIFERIDP